MKPSVTINIKSHPKYLSVIRSVTTRLCEIYSINENIINDLKLAIDEACANVIRHAYKGDTGRQIILQYTITPEKFIVVIEDNGKKADIKKLKGRDLNDIRPGGLGIHFIKKVFDTFELDKTRKKGNRLVLVKELKTEK